MAKTVSSKSVLERQEQLILGGKKFQVFIYLEKRNNCRVSIGTKGIHVRLSAYFSKAERDKQEKELIDWVSQYILKHELYKPVAPKYRQYHHGDTFKIMQREFLVSIQYKANEASKGYLKNGVIFLILSTNMTPREEQKHKTYLVGRLIGNEFQPVLAQRVHELNEIHFKKKIKKLRLRDNISNWGSCSWDGNITISSRLLFAPAEVVDYVLIHELAHLVEHNHSDKFWKLVEHAMPGYRLVESWLEKNGSMCLF